MKNKEFPVSLRGGAGIPWKKLPNIPEKLPVATTFPSHLFLPENPIGIVGGPCRKNLSISDRRKKPGEYHAGMV
jgi:hypothetical protein